jgi:hypothetical protein
MKKFAFTAIFLFILGTAGVLYLEQSNKRFLENLPKAPPTDEQTVNTTNAPVITEDEDIIPLKSIPSETIERHTAHESEHGHPHTLDQTEASVNFEDPIPEPSADATLEPSFEDRLQEDIHILEEEKQITATETLTKIVSDPNNWVKGKPGEVGFGFVLSREEGEAFFGANALLNPTPANRRALEFLRNPPPPPSENTGQETQEFIEYNGGKLYAPIWFWTSD